jgi:uncharacterized protein YukE
MWQGILAGYEAAEAAKERRLAREDSIAAREEDRAFRREMFQAQVLEGRRQTVLQLMMAEREKNAALQAEVRGAAARGFSLDVAQFYQQTGQLGMVMETVAAENYSPSVIRAYEDTARQLITKNSEEGEASDESVGRVLARSLEKGANLNDPRNSYSIMLQEVLNETSIETLEEMQRRMMEGQQRQAMAPLDIATYTSGIDLSKQNQIRNQLIDRFETAFGSNIFTKLADGSYAITANAPPEVSMLVNRAVDEVVALSQGPGRVGKDAENVAFVGNKIMEIAGPNRVEARDLVANFDTAMQSQNFEDFVAQLEAAGADVTGLVKKTPPPPPPPPPPASASRIRPGSRAQIEAMETLGGRNPTTTPSWNIPLDESVIRR